MKLRRIALTAASAILLAPIFTPTIASAEECPAVNFRKVWGVAISLHECQGSLNRKMYYTQVVDNGHYAVTYLDIRYRSTNDRRIVEQVPYNDNQRWTTTHLFYANPNEVQACAYVTVAELGKAILGCAWTANDGDTYPTE